MSLQSKARRLCLYATETETVFWHHLRNRRLAGFKFKRQVPIGPYIVDFLCQQKKLIIEFDGGQHQLEPNRQYDQRRTRYLQTSGYRVLRFWNHQALTHQAETLEIIRMALVEA